MTEPVILVTGATGTIGSELVKQLAEAGQRVRALVRDRAKAAKLDLKAEIVVGDLEKLETLEPAFAGVDKAFVLSAGPSISRMEGNAFTAAKAAGVKHIVKLSGRHIAADFMARAPLVEWHVESEQQLQSLGVPWTILRPGSFASNFLLWLDKRQNAMFLPAGEGKDSFIDPRDIAAVAVKLLTTPGHDGRIYEITSSEQLSFSELAEKISAGAGTRVMYHDIPEETARQGMSAAGIPAPVAESILCYFGGIKSGKIYPPTSAVADLLGRPPRSFDDWIAANAAALRA